MKKTTIKKAGAAALAMAMLLSVGAVTSLSVSAAADNATIKLEAAQGSYKLYRIASADINGEVATFTLNNKYSSVLEYTGGLLKTKTALLEGTEQEMAAGTSLKDVASRGAAAEDLAKKLAEAAAADTPVATKNAATNTTSFSVNKLGYYLIVGTTTGKTQPILMYVDQFGTASTTKTYTIKAKNSETTIDKIITAIDTKHGIDNEIGTDGKTGIVDKGAVVTYQLTTAFPSYDTDVVALSDHFTILDMPEESILIKMDTIAVTVGGQAYDLSAAELTTGVTGEAIEADAAPALQMDGAGFRIVFDDETVLQHGGEAVIVTFGADVTTNNNKLDVNEAPNDNTVQLTYSNNYFTGKGSVIYPENPENPDEPQVPQEDPDNPKVETSFARVYTTVVTANKVDPDGAAIGNARFVLYEGAKNDVWDSETGEVKSGAKAVSNPTPAKNKGSDVANKFVFKGLAAGTYTLVETEVPAGYVGEGPKEIVVTSVDADAGANLAYAGEFTLTRDGEDTADTFDVVNTPKQTLPATGSIGTVLFTVGGAAIILLAGVLFVIYIRKRRAEEE